mmetsp:Transcript_33984/g.6133  ORF Transcript_33984/g.6133 Transcript_33984/m.6133 type:complete len:119 (-) Transcript_33984:321-677(-)
MGVHFSLETIKSDLDLQLAIRTVDRLIGIELFHSTLNYFTPDTLELFIYNTLSMAKKHYPRKFSLESMQGYISGRLTVGLLDNEDNDFTVVSIINPLTDEGYACYEMSKLIQQLGGKI